MNLEYYWDFFSKNSFVSEKCLKIFPDGKFALSLADGVYLYDICCQLLQTFNARAYVFDNGFIIEPEHDGLEHRLYFENSYILRLSGDITYLDNAFVTNNDTFYLLQASSKNDYVVRPFKLKESFKGQEYSGWKSSATGMLYVMRNINGMNEAGLFDAKGINILPMISRDSVIVSKKQYVFFMKCGSYIFYDDGKWTLYSASKRKLLTASGDKKDFSFLGDSCVLYNNALIVNALNGAVFKEYENEIAIIADNIRVYPHLLLDGKLKGYWLGDMLPVFRFGNEYLFVVFYDSRFYIIKLRNYSWQQQDLTTAKLDEEYSLRILQMLPH